MQMFCKGMAQRKKGLSPVIATVLLIGIVIVMALIVFMWIRGINEEAITKFDGKNVKLVCEDVEFDASFSNPNVLIANRGNVPIYQMKAKLSAGGSHETVNIEDNWDVGGLLKGDAVKSDVSSKISGYDTMVLIPVLAGESSEGTKTYTCEERFGKELSL